jgi:hypothetical protein
MAVSWPDHLAPGEVRFGRVSAHYEDTVAFYRDGVGLPVVGEFHGSFGEDGTIFGLPDTSIQLEVIRAHDGEATPPSFDQLVLYFAGTEAAHRAAKALRDRGIQPTPSSVTYWEAHGAECYRDPDGREIVYAPWIYGETPDPEPLER